MNKTDCYCTLHDVKFIGEQHCPFCKTKENYEICCGEVNKQTRKDKWFLDDAKTWAGRSKDPSTGCGTVIVDQLNRVVSTGYNGFPMKIKDDQNRLNDREMKYKLTIHAEINAILFAKRDLSNHTIYVYPMSPCSRCAVQIIQSGITRVVTIKAKGEFFERWKDEIELSKQLFKEAQIEYVEY